MARKTFLGVELAKTGRFEAVTGPAHFTRQDFDDAARAYSELRGKIDVPLKLGHDEGQALLDGIQEDGAPAAGWIANVHRKGNKLIADFVGVPEAIAKMIEAGSFAKRSLEAIRNYTVAGKKYPFVLTAVALLGADIPAVDSLKDLSKLFAASGFDEIDEPEDDAELIAAIASITITAAADDDGDTLEAVLADIAALESRAAPFLRGKGRGAKAAFAEFKRKLMETARASRGTGEDDDMDLVKLRKLLGLADDVEEITVTSTAIATRIALGLGLDSDEATLEAAIKARAAGDDDDDEEGKGDGDDADETVKLRREVDELKAATVTATVTAAVDDAIKARKFSPASRSMLVAMAEATPDEFAKLAKATPDGTIGTSTEHGTSDDDTPDEVLEEFALSDEDAAMARQFGNDPDEVLAQRIRAAGKTMPADLEKKIIEIHSTEVKARASA